MSRLLGQTREGLRIELYGELVALINLANEHPCSKEMGGANNAGCGGSQLLIPNPIYLGSAASQLRNGVMPALRQIADIPPR
jgi:hypothetical protein